MCVFHPLISIKKTIFLVLIQARKETEEGLILNCTNAKKRDDDSAESNGIGHKTCIRIMEEMGGAFQIEETEELYTVKIVISKEGSK